jgi:ATP-binding cassette, subfamily F, member 3
MGNKSKEGRERTPRNDGPSPSESMKTQGVIAQLSDVTFSSPEKVLFYDLSVIVAPKDIVSVMGRSGVGKSTLLKIITGNEDPDEGTVTVPSKVRISYVPQDISDLNVENDISIYDLFYTARGLKELEEDRVALELAMENGDVSEATLNRYSEVLEQYDHLGGYTAESEMAAILAGLKLDKETTGHITPETRLNQVSSGQRTRLLIGQALFAEPQLLVMDDPTSHLDVQSVAWLASYLKGKGMTAVIATNHVPFINNASNKIVEITDFGRVISFRGNHDAYVTKRDSLLEAEKLAAESARKRLEQLRATYMKFKSEGVFKRSQDMAATGRAMQSRMDRMQTELEDMPGAKQVNLEEKVRPLVFTAQQRSGEDVLGIRGIAKSYGPEHAALFLPYFELEVRRGDVIVLRGENGSGKSTFLRVVAHLMMGGDFLPDDGEVEVGASLQPAYYAPDNVSISNEGKILEEVMSVMKVANPGEATAILRFFGFPGKTIYSKTIGTLSMGEKKQLAIAKLMAQHPNVLLLDEPTDYLKKEIQDRLAEAITGFDGTTILISHNPEFVEQLPVTKIITFPEGEVTLMKGRKNK